MRASRFAVLIHEFCEKIKLLCAAPSRMTDEPLPKQYFEDFPGDNQQDSPHYLAFNQALDNRQFEIDLYWKRAAYFWTFIAAAFAGYFVLEKDEAYQSLIYVVTCLGFLFSLAWYFVNRGSKFWQQNWEMHVDLLEDKITGPLYKRVIQPRKYDFWNLTDAYPFSVSKINQILSLLVALVWLVLMVRTAAIVIWYGSTHFLTIGAMTALVGVGVFMLLKCGLTNDSDSPVRIIRHSRRYLEN
jgi:hypothetical protein